MAEQRIWKDWPVCSQCGRSRQTVCPTCGIAGNQFQLADYQVVGEPQRHSRQRELSNEEQSNEEPNNEAQERHSEPDALRDPLPAKSSQRELLLCPRCDEAFKPRFYRVCPACGCDAGEGMEVKCSASGQDHRRVLLAAYGLIGLALLMMLYFWYLFRN